MARAFASSAVVSIVYSDNELPVVQSHLRFRCAAPKDANGTGQHFSAGSPFGQAVLDDLKSGLPMANGICKGSNMISTSIGRKILQNFPRGFSKIQWISLKEETQFHNLLGYQRQGFPNLGNIAMFEASGLHTFAPFGFQIAAASNMLAVANRTPVSVELSAISETLPSFQNACVSSTRDTEAATPPLSSPHMREGIKNKPPALEAWLNDIDSSVMLPGPFRSQQVARERKRTTEIFGSVDQLSRNFEELRFKESLNGHLKFETLGTGFQHNSHGTGRNCNKSSSGGKNTSDTVKSTDLKRDARKGEKKRPRESDLDDSDDGSANKPPRKKTNPGSGAQILCAYYENETDLELKEKHGCSERRFANHREMCEHLRRGHIKPCQCPRCFTRFGRPSEHKRHIDKGMCYPRETIQDYVQEFSMKVMGSTESNLREILYENGEKQYDFADQTDKLRLNPRSSQNTVLTGGTIEDELLKGLKPPIGGVGGPSLHGLPATNPRNLKASIPRDGDELLASFDREFKLANENGEATVELFLRRFISVLPTTGRMVLRYMLDKEGASSLDKLRASNGLFGNVDGLSYDRSAIGEVNASYGSQRGSMRMNESVNHRLEDNQQEPNEAISVQYTSETIGNHKHNVESRYENDIASNALTGSASDSGCGPSVSHPRGAGSGFQRAFNDPPPDPDNESVDWLAEWPYTRDESPFGNQDYAINY